MTMLNRFKQNAPSKSTIAVTLAVAAATGCAVAVYQNRQMTKRLEDVEKLATLTATLTLNLTDRAGREVKALGNQ